MSADSPKRDPQAELRIIAALMGEASDLEREQLDELLADNPQLAEVKKELAEVHGLLTEIGEGDFPESATLNGEEPWQLSSSSREDLMQKLSGTAATSPASTAGASGGKSFGRRAMVFVGLSVAACLLISLFTLPLSIRNYSVATVRLAEERDSAQAVATADSVSFFESATSESPKVAYVEPTAPATADFEVDGIGNQLGQIERSLAFEGYLRAGQQGQQSQQSQQGQQSQQQGQQGQQGQQQAAGARFGLGTESLLAGELLEAEVERREAANPNLFYKQRAASPAPTLADAYGVFGGKAQPSEPAGSAPSSLFGRFRRNGVSGGLPFPAEQLAQNDLGRNWERDYRMDPTMEAARELETLERGLAEGASSWRYEERQRGRADTTLESGQVQLGTELSRGKSDVGSTNGMSALSVFPSLVPPDVPGQTYSVQPNVPQVSTAQPNAPVAGGEVAGQTLPSPYYLMDDVQHFPAEPSSKPAEPDSVLPSLPGSAGPATQLARPSAATRGGAASVTGRSDSKDEGIILGETDRFQSGGEPLSSGPGSSSALGGRRYSRGFSAGGMGGGLGGFGNSGGGRQKNESLQEMEVEPALEFFADDLATLADKAATPAKPNPTQRPGDVGGKNELSLMLGATPAIVIEEEQEALLGRQEANKEMPEGKFFDNMLSVDRAAVPFDDRELMPDADGAVRHRMPPAQRMLERTKGLETDAEADFAGVAVVEAEQDMKEELKALGKSIADRQAGEPGVVKLRSLRAEKATEDLAKKLSELTSDVAAKNSPQESRNGVADSVWFDVDEDGSGENESSSPSRRLDDLQRKFGSIDLVDENTRLSGHLQGMAAPRAAAIASDKFYYQEKQKRITPADLSRELVETNAKQNAFSTFSLHVSDVSFKLAAESLAKGEWPEAGRVRTEEFVNALDYRDRAPSSSQKVACQIEQMRHPFLQQRNLMRVSMKTAEVGRMLQTPLRLTLLIDNSGSMERPDRRQTLLRALDALFQQLTEQDQVTIVLFANDRRLLAEGVSAANAKQALQLIQNAPSEGGTNIEQAIRLGFEKARQQQLEGAQNRVVLFTDGAVNLGDADPDRLSQYVETMRAAGISFDATGICARDLNDEVLEGLTRKGDGRYYLLDANEDVTSSFAKQLAGAFRPVAKNVKVQVEFNPQRVRTYKLLGFEKHRLAKEDFRNDSVDAAELASAEAGVAVYRFEPIPDGSGDVGSVSVRFLDVTTGQMVEKRWPIPFEYNAANPEDAVWTMKLAAVSALFAERLNGGPLSDLIELDELQVMLAELPSDKKQDPTVVQLRAMIDAARSINQ